MSSRAISPRADGVLGQHVIVENKAGAQGIVGAETRRRLPPDGYTFVYVNSSMICINPYVTRSCPTTASRISCR